MENKLINICERIDPDCSCEWCSKQRDRAKEKEKNLFLHKIRNKTVSVKFLVREMDNYITQLQAANIPELKELEAILTSNYETRIRELWRRW